MTRLIVLVSALCALSSVHAAPQDDQYIPGPDSLPQAGVPHGKVIPMEPWKSKIYDGTLRDWWIYVPAQYDGSKPACVMIFCDGGKGNVKDPKFGGPHNAVHVFDSLIHKKEMPVTIGIFITPGQTGESYPDDLGMSNPNHRAQEYEALDDTYARFLIEEILPEVATRWKLSDDPEQRAICGLSSGGICAFTVAWERPDAFRKVLSHIGSFTDIRGGHVYPSRIRKEPVRPVRVFLQDGEAGQEGGLFEDNLARLRQHVA